jgi:hypothetical protein
MRSKHHRKPRSLGGTNAERNISEVCHKKHEAWHILFVNYPAPMIAYRIEELWYGSYELTEKQKKAWFLLFDGMTSQEILDEINQVWLDPDYEIRFVRRST